MTESEQLAWSSHLPALLACIGATTGPVLELGVGHFSTPALHVLCRAMKRDLISIEADKEWHKQFQDKYSFIEYGNGVIPSFHHSFFIGDYLAVMREHLSLEKHWSVAFIDNSPGGKNRADCFKALLPVSDYVVCHDYEKDNEEHIGPLLAESRARYHITRTYQPPTLVASLTRPMPESILCL